MTVPTEPPPGRAWLPRVWLTLSIALVVVRLPWLATDAIERAWDRRGAVGRVWRESATERIERGSTIPQAMANAIREALPDDGRLVIYSPYGGAEFELDAGDPRGMPARQVRLLFERVKNLLYPRPRDVHFARDPEELLGKLAPELAGRLVVLEGRAPVLDGGAAPPPLSVGGRFELLHREPLLGGQLQLRLWRWKGTR